MKKTVKNVMWDYFRDATEKKRFRSGEMLNNFKAIERFVDYLEGTKGMYVKDLHYDFYREYDEKYIQMKAEAEREALADFLRYARYSRERNGG